jgi:hypothetical protein
VNENRDRSANNYAGDEFLGAAHIIWPSEVNHSGDPAAQGVWYWTWPLDHRAALLAALEPGVTLRFGSDAMTNYLHAAHASEALGFNDRRATRGGEGRRLGPGRERLDREA